MKIIQLPYFAPTAKTQTFTKLAFGHSPSAIEKALKTAGVTPQLLAERNAKLWKIQVSGFQPEHQALIVIDPGVTEKSGLQKIKKLRVELEKILKSMPKELGKIKLIFRRQNHCCGTCSKCFFNSQNRKKEWNLKDRPS